MEVREGSHSQSLERGLAILSSFTTARPLLGVSELAREVGLNRSTTHRYVATLAALGYLEQDAATRRYRLGPRVVNLGFSALSSMDLREVAAPHLQRLSDETGHTVNMAVLDASAPTVIRGAPKTGPATLPETISPPTPTPARLTSSRREMLFPVPVVASSVIRRHPF